MNVRKTNNCFFGHQTPINGVDLTIQDRGGIRQECAATMLKLLTEAA